MKLDNYDLSTIHYALYYYMDNADLDEDEMEWIGLLREKWTVSWYHRSTMIKNVGDSIICVTIYHA